MPYPKQTIAKSETKKWLGKLREVVSQLENRLRVFSHILYKQRRGPISVGQPQPSIATVHVIYIYSRRSHLFASNSFVLELDRLSVNKDTLTLVRLWFSPIPDLCCKLHDDLFLRTL